jgi:hypothetical protein
MFVSILMIMPMVQIRPVMMSVLLRFMFMPLKMAHGAWHSIMIVTVMKPIMPVQVLMPCEIMSMQMDMLFAEDNRERGRNHSGSHCLRTSEGLTKQRHRQQQTK